MNKLKKQVINKIAHLFKLHGEYALLTIALMLFLVSPYVFRWYDPTAGSFDIGVLQVNITSIISLSIFSTVAWVMLKILWPDLRKFFENDFGTTFKTLSSWQKIVTSLFVYFFIVYALVQLNHLIPAVELPVRK